MKRMIDHEYYKQPFDLTAAVIFALFLLFIVYIAYNERSKSCLDDRITKFDDTLKIETDQEYYKKEIGRK
jgi:hypothetical protein